MNGTAATANQPANDRHVLAYLKTVFAKLGLEGTNHKFRHSFCTIAVLAGVNFFTLRRWVGHIDEEALKIYVHIADEQAQLTMRQRAERREADRARAAGKGKRKAGRVAGDVGADARAKPARGRQVVSKAVPRRSRGRSWFSKVSAKSWKSKMTRCAMSLGNKACLIRRSSTSGEGGIRTRGPAFDRTRL